MNGDRIQLQQVIINLLLNGILPWARFTDGRASCWSRRRQEEEGLLLVQVSDGGRAAA